MVSVGGNLYRVPDTTRQRRIEVQVLTEEVRIYAEGQLAAALLARRKGLGPDSAAGGGRYPRRGAQAASGQCTAAEQDRTTALA